uniref:t-SNARE coiled-coil homology domain-containing protein n=1 Tax=Hucho hucho TaxID=62062 RepID=A0A4W5QPQ0_9TELE
MTEEGGKLTLRRLEGPIHKFTKVALHIYTNIYTHFQHGGQWERLHQEHINASRTVQQLRANVREMEKLCGRVRPEDGPALERLVQPIRDRASAAAQDYLLLHSNPAPLPQNFRSSNMSRSKVGGSHGDNVGREPGPVNQTQLLVPVIPLNESAAESWDTLEEDLKELSGLVTEFSLLVHSQQEKIDSIEENVNTAAANVEEGTRSLGKVRSWTVLQPAVIGSPIGQRTIGPALSGLDVLDCSGTISFLLGNPKFKAEVYASSSVIGQR